MEKEIRQYNNAQLIPYFVEMVKWELTRYWN